MKEGSEPQGIQKSLSIKQTNMKIKSIIDCSSLQSRVTGNTYEREKQPVCKDYKQPFFFFFLIIRLLSNFNYFLLPYFLARIIRRVKLKVIYNRGPLGVGVKRRGRARVTLPPSETYIRGGILCTISSLLIHYHHHYQRLTAPLSLCFFFLGIQNISFNASLKSLNLISALSLRSALC